MQPLKLILAASALLMVPAAALAEEQRRPPRPDPAERAPAPQATVPMLPQAAPAPPQPVPTAEAVRPPPPDAARPGQPPADPGSSRRPPPPGSRPVRPPPPGWYPAYPAYPISYEDSPLWWGWGWGWGYYPLYPHPPGAQAEEERVAHGRQPHPASTLRLSGAEGGGSVGGVALGIEGRRAGVHLAIDAVSPDRIDGAARLDNTEALGWGTFNATWALLTADAWRLRLEMGGAMLAIPSGGSYAGARYAGTTVLGPDVGLSGHIGLVGPLGLEGHVRVAPFPVAVVDAGLGLALRGGPFAFTAGVRDVDIRGSAARGPKAHVLGPELGLAARF
jgi:hypothetical protein